MYKELFGCLRSALIDKFGNVDAMKYEFLDFEHAALNAKATSFQRWKPKDAVSTINSASHPARGP